MTPQEERDIWNAALDAAIEELEGCREDGETDLRCLRARINGRRREGQK